jgi:hypothetical protein
VKPDAWCTVKRTTGSAPRPLIGYQFSQNIGLVHARWIQSMEIEQRL